FLGLAGCEDGPNQTFSPAGADLANSGDASASFDPATGNFGANYGGVNRLNTCTADETRRATAKALAGDNSPPRKHPSLDMAGDDTWRGLTVEEATANPAQGGNCLGTQLGLGPCPSGVGTSGCGGLFWGDNAEVAFFYNLQTHIVDQMDFTLGYTGTA